MKKKIIAPLVAVGVLCAAGIAWAVLSATVNVPDIAIGSGTGGGSSSCQTSSPTFDVPTPTWDSTLGQYAVQSIDYSGIDSGCVGLGTADLVLTVTPANNNTVLATGTATDMSASSGSITLSSKISFDAAANAQYQFLVRNS